MERIPRPGDLYQDGDGGLYQLASIARHAETGEKLAVYQSLHTDFQVYAMPVDIFLKKMEPVKGQSEDLPDIAPAAAGEDNGTPEEPGGGGEEKEELREQEEDRDAEAPLNPLLLEFVEEEDYGKRLDIFKKMKGSLTQKELDTLYEILDLFHKTGDIAQQADSVESYLKMQKKFDGTRLR